MNTDALVGEIVTRLEPLRTANRQVDRAPDDMSPKSFTAGAAAIWVGYHGSNFGEPEALDHPVQDRELLFDVAVLMRKLNGSSGIHAHLDGVRALLHGHRLSSGKAITLKREAYRAYEAGVWRYDLVFGLNAVAVPLKEEAGAATIQSITIEDELTGEVTEITGQ